MKKEQISFKGTKIKQTFAGKNKQKTLTLRSWKLFSIIYWQRSLGEKVLRNTYFALSVILKGSFYLVTTIFWLAFLDLYFNYTAALTFIAVLLYVVIKEFKENIWQARGNLAPVTIRNGNLTRKLVIKFKSEKVAREFMISHPEVNVTGLGGLAWLAASGENRVHDKLFEILSMSNYAEIESKVVDVGKLREEVTKIIIYLTSKPLEVRI